VSTPQSGEHPAGHLTEEILAIAREATERCAAEAPLGLAVVSGSLAMGLGHALSDLDLYLVRADGSTAPGRTFSINSRTVQVNPLNTAKLRLLVDHVDGFRVESRDRSQLSLTVPDYKLLLRLTNGTPLSADPTHRALFDALDRETVRKLVILRHACYAVELQEDVHGAITSGDLVTAMASSHRALLHALESGLGGVGEVYDHEKVALRRLGRHPGTAHLLEPAWTLLNCGLPLDAPPEELAGVARRRALLTSHLIGYAVLHGWDAPAARLPPFQVAQAGPLRRYDYGLLRFANGIALSGRDDGARVTEPMARLWLALDGRPFDELASSPALEGISVTPEKLRAALGKLADTGAAEVPAMTAG
jgi:hypothetical protein